MRIKDIIENNWKIWKITFIEQELNEKILILKYLSLIKAIPKEWKDKIIKSDSTVDINTIVLIGGPNIKIKNKFKILEQVNSKEIYFTLIEKLIKWPTSINKWIDTYPF